jgi:DNA-binding NarL/FixJ family response regulator
LSSILLVEGHDDMRAALRDWLMVSLESPRLSEARNLQEALDHAEHTIPDLVLMNLELAGPNGIEATRALHQRCPSCPVVIMSVNDSAALRSAALGAGAVAFVSKRELPHGLLPVLGRIGI